MPFPYLDETEELNDTVRAALGGTFVSLPDGVTHYELGGPEDGAPVVLVHGFSVPSFIFDPTFEFLATAGFQVLRYDLIGRGYSDKPNLRYDIHLFTRQLKDLLDALNLTNISLLGLSMGGAITTAFITQHPHYIRKHVLIDPAGVNRVELPPLLKAVKTPILGELLLGLFGSGRMVKGVASDFFDPALVEEFQSKYKIQMRYHGFKRAILSTMRSGILDSQLHLYRQLGALQKPTLLFWGKNDTTTPFKDHTLILEALPHAEFHAIAHCGHIPHYEKPDAVNPILMEFLKR
jgi:pimeloyl-ACP methyl ester carboxylesterase